MKKSIQNDEYIQRFSVDPEKGLSAFEVNRRIEEGQINVVRKSSERTYLQIITKNIFTFFNILMFAIAALYIIFVGFKSIGNMTFILIVTINLVIGIFQECKSKRMLKKLKLSTETKIKVLRNEKIELIDSNEIVLDDVIILEAGDVIPVDGVILEGNAEFNEALLTGESEPVKKTVGETVYESSFIVSGYCKILADKIGEDTYIYSIEQKAKNFKKPKSALMNDINRIIKHLTAIVIPVGILVFWNAITGGNSLSESITQGGSAMVGMIPAGMVLLASVAMATGVIKLGSKKVLVNDLYSVESLSRIDTLCLDKTGTLTDGTMSIEKVIEFEIVDLPQLMGNYLNAFKTANFTSTAMEKSYPKMNTMQITRSLEFSSERKYSAVEFGNGDIYLLGAPEYLTENETILSTVKEYTASGVRAILLVKGGEGSKLTDKKATVKNGKNIALFLIRDTIRANVKDTMTWFDENGVDIRVISGDNLATVSYIARESGIKNWNKCVDMSLVKKEDDLNKIVMENSIFARVSPEQKALIIDILKKNGRVVGVTGDGVNDILAMKKSDCAVALQNGSPATKNISNLTLLDSNFSNMKDAVLEGRRIVNNIQRSSTLFLMKVFFMMFVSISSLLLRVDFPIETSIMGLISFFITGVGSVLLSIEPTSTRIVGSFERNVLGKAIPAGMFMALPAIAIFIGAFIIKGLDLTLVNQFISDQVKILAMLISISGFVVFFNICKPFTRYRRILYGSVLGVALFLLIAIPEFFLNNSTAFWGDLLAEYSNPFDAIGAFISGMFSLKMYKTFSIYQWIFIAIFGIAGSVLYIFGSKKFVELVNNGKLFKKKN